MIFLFDGENFNKKFKSSEDLIQKLNIEEFYEKYKFDKKNNKGIDLFCYICPYYSEINNIVKLCWDENEETVKDLYYNSMDEI